MANVRGTGAGGGKRRKKVEKNQTKGGSQPSNRTPEGSGHISTVTKHTGLKSAYEQSRETDPLIVSAAKAAAKYFNNSGDTTRAPNTNHPKKGRGSAVQPPGRGASAAPSEKIAASSAKKTELENREASTKGERSWSPSTVGKPESRAQRRGKKSNKSENAKSTPAPTAASGRQTGGTTQSTRDKTDKTETNKTEGKGGNAQNKREGRGGVVKYPKSAYKPRKVTSKNKTATKNNYVTTRELANTEIHGDKMSKEKISAIKQARSDLNAMRKDMSKQGYGKASSKWVTNKKTGKKRRVWIGHGIEKALTKE